MRVPARVFADAELLEAIERDELARAAARTSRPCPASWMPRWRCRTSTRATASPWAALRPPRCPTASSRPAASASTSTAACGCWRRRFGGRRARRPPRGARARDLARDPGRDRPRLAGLCPDEGPSSTAVLADGPARCSTRGIGTREDVELTESRRLPGRRRSGRRLRARASSGAATSSARSGRATTSSRSSAWTRSSTEAAAAAFGLREDQVTVLIHSGSRGLGHQVCTDYVDAWTPRPAATASGCPTASSPARPRPPPRDAPISRRWPPRPTSPGPTGSAIAHRVREAIARVARARPSAAGTQAGLRRRAQRGEARASRRPRAVRAPQGRDPRLPAGSPEIPAATGQSASPSSSPAAWARRASCS